MRKGALVIALMIFSVVLPAHADDCRKLVELYNRGTESRDLREKETLFKEALAVRCGEKKFVARVHNNLGDAYENAGRLKEAIAEYKKAIEADPSLPTPYFGLGDVYSKMKDDKSADYYYGHYRKMAGFKTRKKALLIGIDTYKNLPYFSSPHGRRFGNLKGAVDDVRIMKEALKARFDFQEEDIKILTNGEATREGILRAFEDWLIKGTKKEDLTLFYFSGHGTQVPDTNGDEDDGLDEALCAYDTVFGGPSDPEKAKIILDDEIGEKLRKIKARESVVIVDSCNSGTATRSINGVPVAQLEETPFVQPKFVPLDSKDLSVPPPKVAEKNRRSVDHPVGHLFISASREDQYAYEVTMGGRSHGGLTSSLVEGMNTLKRPSYQDLYAYAKKLVKDRYKLSQDPQLEPGKGELPRHEAFQSAFQVLAQSRSEGQTVRNAQMTPHWSEPAPPPETVAPRIVVKVEGIGGGSEALTNALKEGLRKFHYVELSEGENWDCFIRGDTRDGEYRLRLVNRVGDVVKMTPAEKLETILDEMTPHLEYAWTVKQLARLLNPSPLFKVSISVPGDRRDFRLGETVNYELESEEDCHLLVLRLDSHGSFRLIFPNPSQKEGFLRARAKILVPDRQESPGRFEIKVPLPAREETVKVIATSAQIDLKQLQPEGFGETRKKVMGYAANDLPGSGTWMRSLSALIQEKCRDRKLRWSEDTIVVRRH
jgi:tetratricopeptide (TPR) repeat protein